MAAAFFLRYRPIIFVIFLFSETSASWKRNQVTLENGGYNDLLIAINNKEKESKEMIENLKEIFTKGSSFLFKATNRRVYWNSITILVPTSWSHLDEYEPARTETFERANVRIDRGKEGPYVISIQKCGKQGEHMHLSSMYVRDKDYADMWGRTDKTIVHEWAHLRWGVFDEYPYKNEKRFFVDKNEIEATRCSKSVTGVYEDENGGECQLDPDTGLYTKSCQFKDDYSSRQTSTTSIMYKQFLPSISYFCSNNNELQADKHYKEAPNRHNIHCDRQGVWDVILKSDDFKGGNSPALGTVDITPTFRIVQATTRRIVLVLDTSGSMSGDPLSKLRQGAIHYIRNIVPIGSYVGIVRFSSSASQLAPLTLVADGSSRDDLIAKLPRGTGGGTSIGSGVLEGIQVLSSDNNSPDGGYLLVISDGLGGGRPTIVEVLDDVMDSGVIVDTIAFTENADSSLADLSRVSGGTTYFYRADSDSITVLIDSFTATITDRSDQSDQLLSITVYNEAVSIGETTTDSGYVTIDTSVGVDTVFSFTWLNYPIEVALESPDGQRFNQSTDEYNLNSNDGIITIAISERAKDGRWSFFISNTLLSSPAHFVTVTVESKQASDDDIPITITSFVSDPSIDYRATPYITVFAFVNKGNDAVANADVIAILERPNAPDDVIELYDSGASADIEKYDGVYSAYFFNFTGNGRYNVEVKVRGNEQTASVGNARNSRSFPVDGEDDTIMKSVDMFERSASGGALQVSNHVDMVADLLEPSQILDLAIIGVSYQDQSATLQWTAVGDDFDKGIVTEYDIRFAETFQEISGNFPDATKVIPEDVIKGDVLTIKQAGQLEEVTIRLPKRGDQVSYYFAITAVDEANNTGGVSNIVSANLEYIPPLDEGSDDISKTLVLWVVVAVVGVMAILIFTFILKYLRRRPRESSGGNVMGNINPTYA